MRVCVYAASSAKVAPEFHAAARALGESLASDGCSITYSRGSGLEVETTALCAMALMKATLLPAARSVSQSWPNALI